MNYNYLLTTQEIRDTIPIVTCKVCKLPLIKPVVCPKCCYFTCFSCLDLAVGCCKLIDANPRELIDEDGTGPIHPMLSRLEVFCENKNFGCEWAGIRGLHSVHLSICKMKSKKCDFCDTKVLESEIYSHIAECKDVENWKKNIKDEKSQAYFNFLENRIRSLEKSHQVSPIEEPLQVAKSGPEYSRAGILKYLDIDFCDSIRLRLGSMIYFTEQEATEFIKTIPDNEKTLLTPIFKHYKSEYFNKIYGGEQKDSVVEYYIYKLIKPFIYFRRFEYVLLSASILLKGNLECDPYSKCCDIMDAIDYFVSRMVDDFAPLTKNGDTFKFFYPTFNEKFFEFLKSRSSMDIFCSYVNNNDCIIYATKQAECGHIRLRIYEGWVLDDRTITLCKTTGKPPILIKSGRSGF